MKNQKPISEAVQGAVPDKKELVAGVKRDLQSASALMNAILSDPDFIDYVAEFILGRLINDANRKQLEADQKKGVE